MYLIYQTITNPFKEGYVLIGGDLKKINLYISATFIMFLYK